MAVTFDPRLQTEQITPGLVRYIVARIAREINPAKIIVFGSQSKGEGGLGSDLDLFVVNDTGQPNRVVRQAIERLLFGRYFGVDIIVRTPAEVTANLADGNPFYTREIFGLGKVLYDRETARRDT
jgi:predicted nucleotidyltransferase